MNYQQQTTAAAQVDTQCNAEKHKWWFDYEFADGCKLKGFSVDSTVTMNYCDTGKTITLDISCSTKYVNGYSSDAKFGPTINVHAALINYGSGTLQPGDCVCKEFCSYGDIHHIPPVPAPVPVPTPIGVLGGPTENNVPYGNYPFPVPVPIPTPIGVVGGPTENNVPYGVYPLPVPVPVPTPIGVAGGPTENAMPYGTYSLPVPVPTSVGIEQTPTAPNAPVYVYKCPCKSTMAVPNSSCTLMCASLTDIYGNVISSDQCIASLPILEDCKKSVTGSFYVVSMNKIDTTATTTVSFSTVTGTLFEDLNANGKQESGETIYSDITVSLLTVTGQSIMTTTTDMTGTWTFTNVVPAVYIVQVNLPSGVVLVGSENNKLTINVNTTVVVVSTTVTIHGSISGVVWVDANKDGIRNSTKNGFVDCEVSLAYLNGTLITTTTTNTTGYYTFIVVTGYYQVVVKNPDPTVYLFQGNETAPDNKANSSGVVGNLYVTPANDTPANVALVVKPGVKCVPMSSNDQVSVQGNFTVTKNCGE
jgi:SdrD B-like domain